MFTVLRPDSTLSAPPIPLVPLPAEIVTMPPRPPVAAPDPMIRPPLLPALDVPVLNTSMPLMPDEPAFALGDDEFDARLAHCDALLRRLHRMNPQAFSSNPKGFE